MLSSYSPNVPQIDVSEVKKAIDTKQDILLLDVRTPEEYAQGFIKESMLMPKQTLREDVKKITNKTKIIYVHCRSGIRSAQAVEQLREFGYTNVYSMTGGILSWIEKGYPVQK